MKLSRILAVAGLMAVSSLAYAAPVTGVGAAGDLGAQSPIQKVHGDHRTCQEGYGGWHRHNRYGERIPCPPPAYGRPHHHDGYRPPRRCRKDWHCEKSGPFGIEKRCYWRDICN